MPEDVVLALTGDVMTGRGVDQILPSPGDPRLWEAYVRSAAGYVELAERASGPIPRPAAPDWPWGDAASDMAAADLRVINLETSVTTHDRPQPGKAVHYRMHPGNVACLTAVGPDACVLANNHAMDFGVPGLEETLETLRSAGLTTVGAGHTDAEAWRPAELAGAGRRVLLWAVGAEDSGVPSSWAARPERPGIAYLPTISDASARGLGERVRRAKRPGDLAVVSVHWGGNWGYQVPRRHVRFAHALVAAGVDVVHGHSSHHPRPIEIHRNRLVLYGCGDFVDDYEGIAGHESYRDDLRLLHLVRLSPSGELRGLRLVPFRARRMRLDRADATDTDWLCRTLDRESRRFGTSVEVDDGALVTR